jgi:ribose/xylose/arabinose/galactoside ABC-type transport system permease subunit
MRKFLRNDQHVRPLAILALCIIVLALADWGQGRFLSGATAFSTFEIFATIGPVALGLGLTMMIREFDLSVIGMFSMAGCIAVLTGVHSPWIGLALALAAGLAGGLAQGFIIVRLRLGSVAVTLGGLLVFNGIASVLTENRSLSYDNMQLALALKAPLAGVLSIRSVVALAIFAVTAVIMAVTRIGRDVIAIGSDRKAAMIAGVNVDGLMIGIFAFSGVCAALAGVLLSYSLASASVTAVSVIIVPAAAAAILGGVSLSGGTGRPLGIGVGILVLAVLNTGFNAIGAPPYVNDVAMGAILAVVAILDGPHLMRRLSWRSGRHAAPGPDRANRQV